MHLPPLEEIKMGRLTSLNTSLKLSIPRTNLPNKSEAEKSVNVTKRSKWHKVQAPVDVAMNQRKSQLLLKDQKLIKIYHLLKFYS